MLTWVQERLPIDSPARAPMDSIFRKSLRVGLFSICRLRFYRRRFRFKGFKFGVVRVMAMNAKKVGPFPSLERADPFPVNTGLPVAIDIPMTLAAKPV